MATCVCLGAEGGRRAGERHSLQPPAERQSVHHRLEWLGNNGGPVQVAVLRLVDLTNHRTGACACGGEQRASRGWRGGAGLRACGAGIGRKHTYCRRAQCKAQAGPADGADRWVGPGSDASGPTGRARACLLDASLRREDPFVALVKDDIGGLIEALEHAHNVPAVVGDDLYHFIHHAIQHGRHRSARPRRCRCAAAAGKQEIKRDTVRRRCTRGGKVLEINLIKVSPEQERGSAANTANSGRRARSSPSTVSTHGAQ